MSYGPGRSRLLQATLVGAGVWIVSVLLFLVLLVAVFGLIDLDQISGVPLAYPLVVVWFVMLAVFPNDSVGILLTGGTMTTVFLVGAGALTVRRLSPLDGVWDAFKIGASIAIGHALLTVIAFSTLDGPFYTGQPAFRTFALAFGGFVVPATFGAVGGVLYWQLDSW